MSKFCKFWFKLTSEQFNAWLANIEGLPDDSENLDEDGDEDADFDDDDI